jgi:hypothetical protein
MSRPVRHATAISSAGNLSQELREFHEDIISRRKRAYAHTDHTDIRQIIDFRADDGLDAVRRDSDGSTIIRNSGIRSPRTA